MRALAARRAHLVAALALGAVLAPAPGARAATFTVNSTADTSDGSCNASAGGCTLREAIESAVAVPGRDALRFDPAVFPPGTPAVIQLDSVLPVIEDAAGTAIDGAGAGVVVEPGPGVGAPLDPFILSSGTAPLVGPVVANLTVRGFSGTAIQICGGQLPACSQDVSEALVQNVVVENNGDAGIRVLGRVLAKAQLTNVVAAGNTGPGVDCSVASLLGMRVTGVALRKNGGDGLSLHATENAAGNAIADTIASGNGGTGVLLQADQQLAGSRLTNLTADSNAGPGISLSSGTQSDTVVEKAVASHNDGPGIAVLGANDKISLREVASSRNGLDGIWVVSSGELTRLSISDAKVTDNGDDGIEVNDVVRGARIVGVWSAGNAGDGLDIGGQRVADSLIDHLRTSGNEANGIYLVAPAGGGNTIQDCGLQGDGENGIRVRDGNTGNVIQRNVALGSTLSDLRDENASCLNTWRGDVFEFSEGPCIQ